jgi:uncharacterized membrane protein
MKKVLVIGGAVTTFIGIAVLLLGLALLTPHSGDAVVAIHATGALITAIGFFIVGAGVAASQKTMHTGPSAL